MVFELLIAIYLAFFAVLAKRKREWALYVLVFALPSYLVRFEVFGVPMTLLEGMILLLFAAWLLNRFQIKDLRFKIFSRRWLVPIFLFIIASTVSLFIAPDLRAAAGIWKAYIIEPILFLIVLLDTIKTPKQVKTLVWFLGASLVIPGVIAIIQKFTGLWIPNEFWAAEETRRVTSVYGYPNAIGLYFAPIVTLLVGLFVKNLKEFKHNIGVLVVLGVLISIGTLSILFAESKGALLGIGVALLLYALFWKGLRVWFASFLVIGIVAGLTLFPGVLSLDGSKTVAGGGSLEIRQQQWVETGALLKTVPLLGAGLAGYQTAVAPFHEKDYIEIFLYPHNIFLNFWVETGLLGLVAMLWILFLFFKTGFKTPVTDYGLPITGAMVTLLVHGLVDVPYFKNDLSVLFWLLIGFALITLQVSRSDTYGRRIV